MTALSLVGNIAKSRALAWGAAVCVAVASGTFALGVKLGRGWEKGVTARRDAIGLRADADALGQQIAEFRAALASAAQEHAAAQTALADIARRTTDDLVAHHAAAATAARELEADLAARPDLDAVRLGPDLLRRLNAARAGTTADSGAGAGSDDAAAGDPGRVAAPVPADAADAGR